MSLSFSGLLNRIAKRITLSDPDLSDSGEVETEFVLAGGEIPFRLSNNKDFQSGNVEKDGYKYISEQIGFVDCSTEMKNGDYIFDQSNYKEFRVVFVNDMPGGVSDHHKELYLMNTNDITGKGINVATESTTAISFTISWDTYVTVKRAISYGTDKDDEDSWTTTSFTDDFELSGEKQVTGCITKTKYYYRIISKTSDLTEIESRIKTITTS